jgi:RyR domain
MATYEPRPIDTAKVQLSEQLRQLTEQLAENAHDNWARRRLSEGWTWGPVRDDAAKKHPDLVPYAYLPESEKHYDRDTAMETLKAIIALGYRIEPPRP